MPNIQGCLQLSSTLTESDTARLAVELLLCHVLDCARTYLYTWPEKDVTDVQLQAFHALLHERQEGRPVAHLVGMREFWSLPLQVNASTLIPRPDTETLVESVLQLAESGELPSRAHILDLGTGTGAIALAIASEFPDWSVEAVDKSSDAVLLAQQNKERLGFENVDVHQSDWFAAVESKAFHCIVSNPPYIDALDPHLNEGDVRFEPLTALVANDQGWSDIERIIDEAGQHLLPGGWLLIEHGYTQAQRAQQLFVQSQYKNVRTLRDYGGNERITLGQWL